MLRLIPRGRGKLPGKPTPRSHTTSVLVWRFQDFKTGARCQTEDVANTCTQTNELSTPLCSIVSQNAKLPTTYAQAANAAPLHVPSTDAPALRHPRSFLSTNIHHDEPAAGRQAERGRWLVG